MNRQLKVKKIQESIASKKIFMTGATGFFGRSLLDFFMFNPEQEISILTRDSDAFFRKYPQYRIFKKLKVLTGDIQNFQLTDEIFDSILHLATPVAEALSAQNPRQIEETMVGGMARMLEQAVKSKTKEVLFTSSGAAYGKQPLGILEMSEDDLGENFSVYGRSKKASEDLGIKSSKENQFEFKIARCFAFVGPHLDLNGPFAIGNFMRDALNKKDILISGDGTALRSYLDSDDLSLWLLSILLEGRSSEIYNVGSDQAISILALAEKVKKLLYPQANIKVAETKKEKSLPERYIPSIQKAKAELGLEVWTSLDQAILKTATSQRTHR